MKKLTFVLLSLVLGVSMAVAQSKQITGTVIFAEDGEPIIGASVVVKGTTTGTVTDFDGNFVLSVPASAKTMVFSYIGMTTVEKPVQSVLNVTMKEDAQSLDELVVTAMGISKEKKALGYAVQDVKADELTRGANTDLASSLQGKVSGVEISPSSGMPGASSKMTIRGSRSFTGDNSPLYVIDGMPVSSSSDVNTGNSVTGTDFANRSVDIDPNDIESVNILKGQAASALYGMRASNGVVIITTKSGKGVKKGKPEITINTNLSFDVISIVPDLQKEYAQGSGGVFSPTSSSAWGPRISDLANDPTYGGNTDNKYTQASGKKEGQYYVQQRAAAGLNPWATPQAYNNTEDFFQTGVTWSNSANIAQAFDKGSYSFSLGNATSDGIIPTTGMDRYNAKLAAEAKLHANWTTGFNGNFVTSKLKKQPSGNDGLVATIYAAAPSYDLAGIPAHVEGDPYTQNNYRGGSFDAAYWAIENNEFTERSQRFFGNTYLKYSTKFGTDNHKLDVKYQLGTDSYTTNYSDSWGYGHANGRGSINHSGYTISEMNSLLTASYVWNINDDLVFDVLAGNEFVDKKTKYSQAYGANYNFPGWNHIDNSTQLIASESYKKSRTVGLFGSASLAYKNMLYLNVTGRNDVVSTMPRDNRSFFYPSVSLGWIFTELEPLKNDILTYGKLRGSYAQVGQAGTYYDSYYQVPSYGGGFSSGTPIQYPLNGVVSYVPYPMIYDPNLKPQNTESYELGADLTFLNGLVSFNYTFSRQNVVDQIFEVPLAASTGYSSLMMNGGSMHTNSHEFTLNIAPVNTKNVQWDFAFNFSKIDNYVDELAPGVESIMLGGFVEPQVRAGIGYKFPVIYGKSYNRNDAGQIVVNEDGIPTVGKEQVIGTVSPDFKLGFNTSLSVHKFRLSAVLDWKQGGQMYSGTTGLLDYYGVSQQSADLRKEDASFTFGQGSVKEVKDADGNITYAPNDIVLSGADAQKYLQDMNDISESMIFDNSFLKLREIALNYPIIEKEWLTVNVNLFARNILLWSEFKGLDPEAAQGNNNMAGAFERFSLPGTSSYGFGLNVRF